MRSLVRLTLTAVAALVCLSSLAPTAEADGGLRGGFSDDPDQFLFGGQLELSPLGENVYFVPSAEAGFGSDLFSLSFNGDFQYRFDTDGGVRPYVGAGVALWWFDSDNSNDSETEFGVNALGGIYFGSDPRMFVDLKLGLTDDIPDLKFIFGVNFL
jgi:hypothetical protein